MNKNKTHICIVLDRSGSMEIIKNDMIQGLNSFLDEQKRLPGECKVSLVQFDHEYETIYWDRDISDTIPRTTDNYKPRGSTSLVDAMGRTIVSLGKILSESHEDNRPGKVIFITITDGEENSSKEFSRNHVFDKITHQTDKYNWQFIYIGANQDAIKEGHKFGYTPAGSLTFASTKRGTQNMYRALNRSSTSYRCGDTDKVAFDNADRQSSIKEN
jgi:Mg-chelatase subunit ChlD